jgi:regulator of protease activity HflC (stomatin/prohibitin superfamily)
MPRADSATPIDTPDDERRLLLSIEQTLQNQIHAAREHAAGRILEARAAGEQRIAAARAAAARADADLAREERINQEAALAPRGDVSLVSRSRVHRTGKENAGTTSNRFAKNPPEDSDRRPRYE